MKIRLLPMAFACAFAFIGMPHAEPMSQRVVTTPPLTMKATTKKSRPRIKHPVLVKFEQLKKRDKVEGTRKRFDLSGALKTIR